MSVIKSNIAGIVVYCTNQIFMHGDPHEYIQKISKVKSQDLKRDNNIIHFVHWDIGQSCMRIT